MLLRLFTTIAALLVIAGFARAEPREISVAVFFAEQSSTVQKVLKPWAEWVGERAGDEIKIKIYAGGSLGRDPTKQLKMVEDRVADAAFVNFSFTRGRFPESTLFELPLLVHNVSEGSKAISLMHERGLIRGLDTVKVVALNTSPAVVLHSTEPIETLDDVAGWKVRSGGATENRAMELIDAVPVGLGPGEIAESLSRGLITGALLDWNAWQTFRVSKVTSHHYDAAIGGVLSFMIAMNKDVFDSLSPKAQQVIEDSGDFINERHVAAFSESVEKAKATAEAEGTLVTPNDAELERLSTTFQPLHKEWIAQHGAERYDALVKILRDIRAEKH